jgi:hypothetical protein
LPSEPGPDKEIMRLLKRYLARELFRLLKADLHHAQQLN